MSNIGLIITSKLSKKTKSDDNEEIKSLLLQD